jgi:hypothetical protein
LGQENYKNRLLYQLFFVYLYLNISVLRAFLAYWQPQKIAIFKPRKSADKAIEKRAQKTQKSRKAQ